jgi:aminoglycoside phosphotransferase family enzyme
LARPESRPHQPDKVEVHKTHISWVFLAGDRVSDGVELVAERDARAIDFVVEMVRYDEGNTLTARLERGEHERGCRW